MKRLSPASTPADPQVVATEALRRVQDIGVVALCHVLEVSGSTPCKPGWKKLVTPDGDSFGNLGGGSFEARVVADAVTVLDAGGKGLRQRYYFTEQAVRGEATEMSCGGFAEVWIEVMRAKPLLVVCGGGPVGEALAANALVCDFEVHVVDDRTEFAQADLHPGAGTRQVQPDYADLDLHRMVARELYVAVVSRSWETDTAAINAALEATPGGLRYLGLMGSRRKIDKVRAHLTEAAASQWERVEAPIGLEIGAETPTEIAVSILARLIAVRRQLSGSPSD